MRPFANISLHRLVCTGGRVLQCSKRAQQPVVVRCHFTHPPTYPHKHNTFAVVNTLVRIRVKVADSSCMMAPHWRFSIGPAQLLHSREQESGYRKECPKLRVEGEVGCDEEQEGLLYYLMKKRDEKEVWFAILRPHC